MLPLTRKENWLAKIAGDPQADEAMTPRTREEYFLNEIAENGGGGGGTGDGVLVVHDDETGTLDKTWQEISDAPVAVVVQDDGTTRYTFLVAAVASFDGEYYVSVFNTNASEMTEYSATAADGFPVIVESGGE